jgi:hypothetical protein
MTGNTPQTHTIEELESLLAQIQEKFKWLGDYL